MKLVDILASLFPKGHNIVVNDGLIAGNAVLAGSGPVAVIGVDGKVAIGVDEAIRLGSRVLDVVKRGGREPILVLIDSDSQRMSKRDELLGLSQCLAHLAMCLIVADARGHRTIGLLYGHTAAGAFIATALATRTLLALPGAEPAVMDLPSMSRVTKLPLALLQEKAATTPVFAPGLDNLAQTGAIETVLDPHRSLADQLWEVLGHRVEREDVRDRAGQQRKGRPKAADIARRVYELARAQR